MALSPAPLAPPERLLRLDAVRGIAACIVAFGVHLQFLFAPGTFGEPGPPLIGWFHRTGWTCVDLFFVLSGYIFAHVYLRPGKLADRRALREFAIARFARLYPLHLATFLVCALLFWRLPANTLVAGAAHLVMAQALVAPIGQTFDGPAWSLSVESLCYVVFALAAFAGRRTLAFVTALAVAAGACAITLAGPQGEFSLPAVLGRALFGFFVGQCLWHGRARLARVPSGALAAVAVGGFAAQWLTAAPLLPLVFVSWPAALLLALRAPILDHRWFRWLGERSYSIYLVHIPLFNVISQGQLHGGPGLILAVHVIVIAAVLLLANLTYRTIEQPWRARIRNRFLSAAEPKPGNSGFPSPA